MPSNAAAGDQLMIDEPVGDVRGTIAEAGLDVDLDTPADRRARPVVARRRPGTAAADAGSERGGRVARGSPGRGRAALCGRWC